MKEADNVASDSKGVSFSMSVTENADVNSGIEFIKLIATFATMKDGFKGANNLNNTNSVRASNFAGALNDANSIKETVKPKLTQE